jgi:hypothetical protein
MLYVPGPKVLWTVAVPNAGPDVIIHALPTIAESSQYFALLLQNNTCPVIVPDVVEVTVAVSVTAVSGATLLGVILNAVVVAAGCAQAAVPALRTSTTLNRARIAGNVPNIFIDSLSSERKIQCQATIYTSINYHCGAPHEFEMSFSALGSSKAKLPLRALQAKLTICVAPYASKIRRHKNQEVS